MRCLPVRTGESHARSRLPVHRLWQHVPRCSDGRRGFWVLGGYGLVGGRFPVCSCVKIFVLGSWPSTVADPESAFASPTQ